MLQPNILQKAWASGGAKTNPIPVTTTQLGYASLDQGFPYETERPLDDNGVPPRRVDFNGAFYMLSMFAMYQQSGGMFTYSTQVDYDPPCIVYYNGDLWWCLQANGVGEGRTLETPAVGSIYWQKFKDYLSNPLSAYPVGAYYISSNSTSPQTLFGGKWVQIQDRFIMAKGSKFNQSVNSTGGNDTVKLTTDNIPSHDHSCSTVSNHTHGAGSLRITGSITSADPYEVFTAADQVSQTGALRLTGKVGSRGGVVTASGAGYMGIDIDTNRSGSWSGVTAGSGQHNHTIGKTGKGTAFSVMNPYIIAYVWRRTE